MNQTVSELASAPRYIVSYFEHETDPAYFDGGQEERAAEHVAEITGQGFTNVVLCVTETDIQQADRLAFLRGLVGRMHDSGLEVWADPWRVGSVFGGEAVSHFERSGEVSCLHNRKLRGLVSRWLDRVASLEVDAAFWDEPEMKCDDHRDYELPFLEKYTAEAGRLGLSNVVCLCANEAKRGQLAEAAAFDDVSEIATDPYYPNAFNRRIGRRADGGRDSGTSRAYVASWAQHLQAVAAAANVRSHLWVQLFDVGPDDLAMPAEFAAAAAANGVQDIGMWGFRACASVPQLADRYDPAHLEDVWRQARAICRDAAEADADEAVAVA